MADEETEETVAEDTPTPETAQDAPAAEETAPAEPEASASGASEPEVAPPASPAKEAGEPVTPKQRRARARAAKAAAVPTRAQMTPQERQAERDAGRQRKAGVRRSRRVREREKAREQRRSAPAGEPLPALHGEHGGGQKTRQGIVVSDKAAKTIIVRIDVARRHPKYDKVVRTSTTLHAHDEQGDAHIGDTVVVRESRPLSRTKRWRLVEVLERAK
jgi:small subunit ribosomal protein S17